MNKAWEWFSWHDFFHFTRSYLKIVLWCLVASCCSLVMAVVARHPLARLYLEFHDNCESVNPGVFMDDGHVRSNEVMKAILEYVTLYDVTRPFFDIANFNSDGRAHGIVTFFWRPQAIMGIRAKGMSNADPDFVFPADFTKEIFSFFDGAYMSLKSDKRSPVLDSVRQVLEHFVNEEAKVVCMSDCFEDLKAGFTYRHYVFVDKAFTLSYVDIFHN